MNENDAKMEEVFQNNSDCYADTGRFENDGSYKEGEVIQAMTLPAFKKAMQEFANQQSEGMEKRIAELERENSELKLGVEYWAGKHNEVLKESDEWEDHALLSDAKIDVLNQQIYELQKENETLKSNLYSKED